MIIKSIIGYILFVCVYTHWSTKMLHIQKIDFYKPGWFAVGVLCWRVVGRTWEWKPWFQQILCSLNVWLILLSERILRRKEDPHVHLKYIWQQWNRATNSVNCLIHFLSCLKVKKKNSSIITLMCMKWSCYTARSCKFLCFLNFKWAAQTIRIHINKLSKSRM